MSRFAARTVAITTFHLLLHLKLLRHSRADFFEGEAGFQAQVATSVLLRFGTSAAAKTAEAAEAAAHTATDVAEVREDVVDVGKSTATSKTSGAIQSGFAKLVVALTLFGVAEHFVGFSSFFEFFLRFLIAGIFVGVIFHGHLAVGLFDVGIACALVDTQYFVIIEICHCRKCLKTRDSSRLNFRFRDRASPQSALAPPDRYHCPTATFAKRSTLSLSR